MMKSTKLTITIISDGNKIGELTCDEFRAAYGNRTSFIPELVAAFNKNKAEAGEPERAEQTIKHYY